jgi:hypothetical protein
MKSNSILLLILILSEAFLQISLISAFLKPSGKFFLPKKSLARFPFRPIVTRLKLSSDEITVKQPYVFQVYGKDITDRDEFYGYAENLVRCAIDKCGHNQVVSAHVVLKELKYQEWRKTSSDLCFAISYSISYCCCA